MTARRSQGSSSGVTRRTMVQGLGTLAAAQALHLIGCSRTTLEGSAWEDAGAGGEGPAPREWASGGTAGMTGTYRDPFAASVPAAECVLACTSTLGPCYASTLVRKDLSEGHDGLPMRLSLEIVDDGCRPIEGATVDIWHTAPEGMYSGSDTVELCTLGDPDAVASRWFRGMQTTDARGRVDFDTCFPGWYSGRTVHIHFTVRVGETELATSQLFFDDALSDEIISSQPLYKDRGPRDTKNSQDAVIHGSRQLPPLLLETERTPQGALLAYKTLTVRSSTAQACAL